LMLFSISKYHSSSGVNAIYIVKAELFTQVVQMLLIHRKSDVTSWIEFPFIQEPLCCNGSSTYTTNFYSLFIISKPLFKQYSERHSAFSYILTLFHFLFRTSCCVSSFGLCPESRLYNTFILSSCRILSS